MDTNFSSSIDLEPSNQTDPTSSQSKEMEIKNELMTKYPDAFVYAINDAGKQALTINSFGSYMLEISRDETKQEEYQNMNNLLEQSTSVTQNGNYSPPENQEFFNNVLHYANLDYNPNLPLEFTDYGIRYKTMNGYGIQPLASLGSGDRKRFEALLQLSDIVGKAKKPKDISNTQASNIEVQPTTTSPEFVAATPIPTQTFTEEINTTDINSNSVSETPSVILQQEEETQPSIPEKESAFPGTYFEVGEIPFYFEDLHTILSPEYVENVKNWLTWVTKAPEPIKGKLSVETLINLAGGEGSANAQNIKNFIDHQGRIDRNSISQ